MIVKLRFAASRVDICEPRFGDSARSVEFPPGELISRVKICTATRTLLCMYSACGLVQKANYIFF